MLALVLTASAAIDVWTGKHIDFAVYWYDIRGFFTTHRPLYGPGAVMGFPMIFRYPPVFALLFFPLTKLPFAVAGAVWACLEALVLFAAVCWLKRTLSLSLNVAAGLGALFIAGPYLYLTFKDGNMQWFVTVLTLVAIVLSDRRPALSGCALAFGASIKIWPLLFVPLLLARARRPALWWTALAGAVLWLLPVVFFGPSFYWTLLRQWSAQESANHVALGDIWYPSQSLRGLLLRYLTDPLQTLPYHAAFADVHLLALSPAFVVAVWAIAACASLLYVAARSAQTQGLERTRWDFLYFVAFSALQPYCNWSSLITLTPAVLLLAHLVSMGRRPWPRRFFWSAVALTAVCLATSLSRQQTRLLQVIGIHFFVMLCLAGALFFADLPANRESASLTQSEELSDRIFV